MTMCLLFLRLLFQLVILPPLFFLPSCPAWELRSGLCTGLAEEYTSVGKFFFPLDPSAAIIFFDSTKHLEQLLLNSGLKFLCESPEVIWTQSWGKKCQSQDEPNPIVLTVSACNVIWFPSEWMLQVILQLFTGEQNPVHSLQFGPVGNHGLLWLKYLFSNSPSVNSIFRLQNPPSVLKFWDLSLVYNMGLQVERLN